MSLTRYALRTAGFGALYLLATAAGLATASTGAGVRVVWPAAVAGALWLVAQGRYGRRNLDVIALSVLAVLAPGHGGGLLNDFVQAVPQVVPALVFAWLFDRWLPGYWLGHGDRFRRHGPALGRLAGAAGVAAGAGAVLYKVVDTGLGFGEAGYVLVRDFSAVVLAVLIARGVRRAWGRRRGDEGRGPGDGPRRPDSRRGGLTVVK
ncbi:hypothetical protein [Paractinoplanes lichenicola]|uniref:Integral membrane protein n=1 Tax=Paractinoplanes lichenicola TaxID=2802976 RepID=A0ABS1VSY7_9ACTN|nr:hypothetical protein [Actinoplanes lichenicola]MBL7257575.1 hypothetical protein [Actinoplanes lichenicola]